MRDKTPLKFKAARRRLWLLATAAVVFFGFSVPDRTLPSKNGGSKTSNLVKAPIPTAKAQTLLAEDMDRDGLPNQVETIFRLLPMVEDTNNNGTYDGYEWVMRADSQGFEDIPAISPAIRAYAYEHNDSLQIFVAVFPLEFADRLQVYVGSPDYDSAPIGNDVLGMYNVTTLLPMLFHTITWGQHSGLQIFGFTLDLPLTLVDNLDSLSVAFILDVADTQLFDEISLVNRDGQRMVFYSASQSSQLEELEPGEEATFYFQPLSSSSDSGPAGMSDEPQYCSTSLSKGTPSGAGSVDYVVNSASCAPDGLLFCMESSCSALEGSSFTLIDYGFLSGE